MIRIGLFGASGFVGENLIRLFSRHGISCVALNIREFKTVQAIAEGLRNQQITHVIYSIGRAHDFQKANKQIEKEYYYANSKLAYDVALACKQSKVTQMIYLSSSKVYGNLTLTSPVEEDTLPLKLDLYGETKRYGEENVIKCLRNSNTLPIIIRMPLVYGRGVKGNLRTLRRLLDSPIPLPLQSINFNRRSMLSVTNLHLFILHLISQKNFAHEIYNVKDERDYSTYDIVDMLMSANAIKNKTFPASEKILRFIIRLISKNAEEKIMENHLISDKRARYELGWVPSATEIEDFKTER